MAFGKKKKKNKQHQAEQQVSYLEKNIDMKSNPFYPAAAENHVKEVLNAIGIAAVCLVLVGMIISKFSLMNMSPTYADNSGYSSYSEPTEQNQTGGTQEDPYSASTEDTDLNAGQQAFSYTDNDMVDLSACLTTDAYASVTSEDGSYSFAYPKYMFNSSSLDNGVYTFAHHDGDVADYQLKVYKESNSGNPIDNANALYHRFSPSFTGKYFEMVSDSTDSQGMARALLAGYLDSLKQEGVYIIAANDGSDNYILEFHYYDNNSSDEYKDINYVVDCVYRGCSFSGTTYRLRTFSQFQADDMGEKK
ncbi:MAG: hypothetical protein Q4E73_11095 [Lachnospiraceae bacterium]|nr:hypothetical protein [Lachnospiraceae bacterium]